MFFSIDARKNAVKRVEKAWGYELWFANDEANNYCGKIVHIYAGSKFSMHYHMVKAETLYVLTGKVKVRIINGQTAAVEEGELFAGEAFEIQPGLPYQLEAIDGYAQVIETSTFHMDCGRVPWAIGTRLDHFIESGDKHEK